MSSRGSEHHFSLASAVSQPESGLGGSLAFLGLGYLLILASPLLSAQFQTLLAGRSDVTGAGPWLPAAAAAGVALLGAAAMMLVLARLVRDVEERPYASIAPVLTVFTGFILMGLRAKLPFEGLASQHLGVFALSLSLCGGALICRDGFFVRLMGWLLTLMPPAVVAYALAVITQEGDVMTALRRADPQVRVYVVLLSLSAVALGLVGTAARLLARPPAHAADAYDTPRALPRLAAPAYHAGQAPGYGPGVQRAPRGFGGLSLDLDDDIAFGKARRNRTGLVAAALVTLAFAGFGAYQFVIVPRRDQAALAARAALDARTPSAADRAAEALRSEEAAAAKARLEALMAAPSAAPASPDATPAAAAAVPPAAEAAPSRAPAPAPVAALVPAPQAAPARRSPVPPAAAGAAQSSLVPAAKAAGPDKAVAELRPAKKAVARRRAAAARGAAREERAAPPSAAARVSAEQAAPAKAAPAPQKLVAEAARPATKAAEPAKKAEKPAPQPEPTNSADLDLDQLVQKALKQRGASSVSAADDPLVGL